MDSSQEEKQNFLREKILEKGYDTNQFVQFLIDKKGEDGADVGVWTMSDLKKVVREFIKLNGGEIEEEEPPKVEQKQYTKKISMFDVLGETKPKIQPQPPTIQKAKSEPPKQTPKVETQPQPQNKQNNETPSNPPANSSVNNNTNAPPNRTASITLTGNESEYGVIIPDTKKCKPCETTDIGKSQNVSITISKP